MPSSSAPVRPDPKPRKGAIIAWVFSASVLGLLLIAVFLRATRPSVDPIPRVVDPARGQEQATDQAAGSVTSSDDPAQGSTFGSTTATQGEDPTGAAADSDPTGVDAPMMGTPPVVDPTLRAEGGNAVGAIMSPVAAGAALAVSPYVNGADSAAGSGENGAASQPTDETAATEAAAAEDVAAATTATTPVRCGEAVCPDGQVCCNPSCGICTQPGGSCSQRVCGMDYTPTSVQCGNNTCNVGFVCCNASCGTCVRPGESCSQTECRGAVQYPSSEMCGMTTCNVGFICCNPSCGTCIRPGESCSQEAC